MPRTTSLLAASALLALALLPAPSRGQGAEAPPQVAAVNYDDLGLYLNADELVETASRYPKPLSQVAENVTVITAEEIEAQHAHSLAEVLAQVPGLFVSSFFQDVGSEALFHTQGSEVAHTLVLIDGVRYNAISYGYAVTNGLPLGIIKRIEIIKGPASSSWGSSLGGVVNIITKEAGKSERPQGQAAASVGERGTTDVNAQAAGKLGPLGYYLFGEDLESDGHWRDAWFDNQPLYAKLSLPLNRLTLGATIGHSAPRYKCSEIPDWDMGAIDLNRTTFSTLYLDAPLGSAFNLHLAASRFEQRYASEYQYLGLTGTSAGEVFYDYRARERTDNLSGRLSWSGRRHSAVIGFETNRSREEFVENSLFPYAVAYPAREEKRAVYSNVALNWGELTVTPGLRYDHSSNTEGAISPSLGAAYRLGSDTILRGIVARGFNTPDMLTLFGSWGNPEVDPELVTSVQGGVETVAVPRVRLAATLFHHRLTEAIVANDTLEHWENQGTARRQGLELEADTLPWHRLTLGAKASLVNSDTAERENDTMYAANLIARYDHPEVLSLRLGGRYIWWGEDETLRGEASKFDDFIWDLAVSRQIYANEGVRAEIFGVVRNLGNGSQYWEVDYQTPGRWLEAGVTVRF